MRYFDGFTGRLAVYACLALLFLPKINLLSLGGRETAGIRVDDLVLFCFAFLFFWSRLSLRRETLNLEKAMGAIVVLSLASFVLNRLFVTLDLLQVDASVLYAFRPLEYFLFFYVGWIASRYCSLTPMIYAYFYLNAVLIFLQKFGVVGGFTNRGYLPDVTDRPPGLASFPSEMGVLLNMMFCYIVYRQDGSQTRKIPFVPKALFKLGVNLRYFLFFLFVGVLIVITGSRIAILAHLVSFAPFLIDRVRSGSFVRNVGIGCAMLLSVALMFYSMDKITGLVARSSGLFSWNNVDLINDVWKNIDVSYVPTGHEIVERAEQDESWWIRIHKWMYALKIYLSHPECYLQGVGPGFGTAALDGGLLRILVELGLLGVAFFGRFFRLIAGQSQALFWSIVCFMINMIFFDVYLAYKSMTLLLLMAGFADAKQKERGDDVRHFCAV